MPIDEQSFNDHAHTGRDGKRINPVDLLGFPIVTAAPTDTPLEGTVRLGNVSGAYKLYAYINGGWRAVTLT